MRLPSGHPSNSNFHRMSKLGGASKERLELAKNYECPTCAQDVEVRVDLKYAQNVKGETFAALSMVDAATNYHRAVLVKTRKPGYITKKFLKHWVGLLGGPILMLESYGIFSTTTAAHVRWRHTLAERHGGVR